MPLIPGVTTGLYQVARPTELATPTKKVGYVIPKGVAAFEFAGDIPHEVTYSEGEDVRHIMQKQGMTVAYHGSLTVPIELPDRTEWRDADDHIKRSIRSAVHVGAVYIDFHASLNSWLELITYAGRKLSLTFVDHEGRFISTILKENERLREWFIKYKWEDYMRDIFTRNEQIKLNSRVSLEEDRWRREYLKKRVTEELKKNSSIIQNILNAAKARGATVGTVDEFINEIVNDLLLRGVPRDLPPNLEKVVRNLMDESRDAATAMYATIEAEERTKVLREKLSKGDRWESEELRSALGVMDGYHIMAHYLFFTKDPQWMSMASFYGKVLGKYKINYSDNEWLRNAWREAESKNDVEFKEFFYGVCAAKYIEGHMKKMEEWLNNEFIGKELAGKPELQKIARELKIGFETPDARDPTLPGRYMIWRPKQIYSMVKTMRSVLKSTRYWLIPDFEHTATQGVDAVLEYEQVAKEIPDFGKYIISCHSNSPNPLHPHDPVEFGDMRLYRILYALRKVGLGKEGRTAFLILERGGGEDPVMRGVDAIRTIIKYLEKEIAPADLGLDFFGITEKMSGNMLRQEQIVRDHAYDPMKDLLEMSEEEWTMLSQAAIKKGKRPEVWKRGEFR
ncbi:MAG: hypothetical protein HY518_01180 [Candidatus Aenigmarchaeota archaeon]|nr:hypothetical protein [Candidatus Aenigmarchaeota archaeon]